MNDPADLEGWVTHSQSLKPGCEMPNLAAFNGTDLLALEKPESRSARLHNVIAGHLVGLGAGFFALWVLHAWASPKVMSSGFVAAPRIWTAVLSAALTAGITLVIGASHPASLATTPLVSLGVIQTRRDAVGIIVSVLLLSAIGEPVRRMRTKVAP